MKRLLLILLFINTLSSSLSADMLQDKIENIMKKEDVVLHRNLLNVLFKDRDKFYTNSSHETLNLAKILTTLKENGLMDLKFSNPTTFHAVFVFYGHTIKSLKVINDTLKSIGYYYYNINEIQKDGDALYYSIDFKTEYAIDPTILYSELIKSNAKLINIEKIGEDNWKYFIDTRFSSLANAMKVPNNEKIKLGKPLKPYFVEINRARKLKIINHRLNHWYPYLVFYDSNLNILKVYKNESAFRNATFNIPSGTKFIKISDLYNLINIKRGISIILKD
jgi:hypothetical protein